MAISAHSRFTTQNLITLIQKMRKSLNFSIFYFLCLIFCLTFLSSCTNKEGAAEEGTEDVSPADMDVQVKTAKIETGEMPIIVKAVGVLMPAMQSPALVVPQTPGIVSKVEVTEGQMIEAGAIIICLDPRRADNAIAKAKAALNLVKAEYKKASDGGLSIEQADLDLDAAQAEAALEQAKLNFDRQKSLLTENLISEKTVYDAQKALEEAERRAKAAKDKADIFRNSGKDLKLAQLQASVEATQAELVSAEFERETMDIRAPQSGRISGLKVNVGSSVDDNTILAKVIGKQTVVIRLQISPADTENIELNAPVTIRPISSKELLSGKIISIGFELDDETGLVAIEAKLDSNQQSLIRMGETVFAEIASKLTAKGFIVPASSIVIENDKASLFTVDGEQIAHAVPIEILTRTADKAVVYTEGLDAGARVIIDGNYNLPDGAHVVEELPR
jgi:multidrug efflux pump subunit AcrA (membrane-fusion protein)